VLDLSRFLILWVIIISLSPVTVLFIHGLLLRDISVRCYCHINMHILSSLFVIITVVINIIQNASYHAQI